MPISQRLVPLVAALWLAGLAQGQGLPNPATSAPGTPMALALASNSLSGMPLQAGQGIEFVLTAPLAQAQGRLVFMLNGNDLGSFLQTVDGIHYTLQASDFPLPAGTSTAELLIEPAGGGEPIALWSASIEVADQPGGGEGILPDNGGDAPGGGEIADGPVSNAPSSGLKTKLTPRVSVTSTRRDVDGVVTSSTSREIALQAGAQYERNYEDGSRLALAANLLGSSVQARAVRFAQAGPQAAKFDLNDYLLEYQTDALRLSLGHVSVAGHPLLGAAFANRGVSGSYRLAGGLDVALTSQHATSIVGAPNLLGLRQIDQRVHALTLGWDLNPGQPGALRLEATGMSGELSRPVATPGTGALPESEKSSGVGLRVVWAPVDSIYRVESAYAVSTSTRPDGFGGEQVARGRKAWFADGSARVIDSGADGGVPDRKLTLRLRHEYADLGFRSVAGGATADVRRTLVSAEGLLYGVQGQWARTYSNGNVRRSPNLPVLHTRSDVVSAALPLATWLDPTAVGGSWWPTLQGGLQYNVQRPSDLPAWMTPDLVPASASRNETLNAQWTQGPVSWSVGLTRGLQDNRQPGQDMLDQKSRGAQAQLQWQVLPSLMASAGWRRARATQLDTGIAQIQNGGDLGLAWTPEGGWVVNATLNRTGSFDSANTQRAKGLNRQLQVSRSLPMSWGPNQVVPLQLSLAWQSQGDNNASTLLGSTVQNTQRVRSLTISLSATF